MAKLYDKKTGKEFNVPHAVDVKDWLNTGDYTSEKPTVAKAQPKKRPTLPEKD